MDLHQDAYSLNSEELNAAVENAKSKLDSACRQIAHLDSQISNLRKLFRRAEKNRGYSIRYNLRMQLSIISGVKVMYHHYAAFQEDQIARLRMQISRSSNSEPAAEAEESNS